MKTRSISLLIVACLVLSLAVPCFAVRNYTYTVTLDAGRLGTIGSDCVSVEGAEYSVSTDSTRVTITGLNLGDIVSFDLAAITVTEDSRYYVRGIRESGRDNNTVGTTAFRVTGDNDYVVAYGIKGTLTQYTVKYQDEAGKELRQSRTYYGNVGDKPVVAYLYIDKYEPKALNITKTLVADPAQNVIIFVYKVVTENVSQPTNRPTKPSTSSAGAVESGELLNSGRPVDLLVIKDDGEVVVENTVLTGSMTEVVSSQTSGTNWILWIGVIAAVVVAGVAVLLVVKKTKKA